MNSKQISLIFMILTAISLFSLAVNAEIDTVTAAVTPTTAYKTSTLDCGFNVTGNASSYLVNITWTNGTAAHVTDDENGITVLNNTLTSTTVTGDIEPTDLRKGEAWRCVATAYDSDGNSLLGTSAAVTILNSAPVFVSTAGTTARTNALYTYNAAVSDADSDTITYSLTTAPTGMAINSATGVIIWTPAGTQTGSHNVTIQATDGSVASTQSYILTVSNNRLIINKISAKCSPVKCDDDGLDIDGGSIDDVRPGSKLTVEVRVENDWPDGTDDHEIQDIEISATLEEMGDEDDQDFDLSVDDVKPGDRSETVEFEFNIPNEVDEDTYTLEITVTGEDEDGTDYKVRVNIDVDVRRETHKLLIKKASVSPSSVSCNRRISVPTLVKNVGARDQDDVELTIISKELGISSSEFFDLDEGDYDDSDTEREKIYTFNIADSVEPGTYEIEFKAYYKSSGKYERVTAPLIVQTCGGTTNGGTTTTGTTSTGTTGTTQRPTTTDDNVQVIYAPPTSTRPGGQVAAQPVTGETESFTDSSTFIVVLVVAIVALFVVGAMMLYMLFRK